MTREQFQLHIEGTLRAALRGLVGQSIDLSPSQQLSFEFEFEEPRQPVQLEFRFLGTGEQQQTGENQ